MAQTFEDITKVVVNRFLQNILFIDDKAYQPDNKENEFDASQISSIFAKNGKLCTIFAPASESDLSQCSALFSKADVIVLDWYLDLTTSKASSDDEEDAEADEPRGYYTKSLIKDIVTDAKNEKLKIVVVYTGETDLRGITKDIHNCIAQYNNFELGDCCVYSSNIVIVVRAKYNGDEQFKHLEDLRDKVVKYEKLPILINDVFAKLTNGLLPNFALSAISSIREQTSKILRLYSAETDTAYLGHRVLLTNQSDAHKLLLKIFGESLSDLIASSNTKTDDWLSLWVDSKCSNQKTINIGNKSIIVSGTHLKDLLLDDTTSYKEKVQRIFNGKISQKEAINNSTLFFSTDEVSAQKANIQFAILTHHKNAFGVKPDNPFLTLGTVVLNSDNYYVCIQQRCDSVRLKGERKFLFLPLTSTDSNSNIHIVIDGNHHLGVSNSTYAIKTVKFKPQDGEDCIYAKNVAGETKENKYIFESIYGEVFEWILELKELHAQRIVDAYCSLLSRVGLDESEWLRLLK